MAVEFKTSVGEVRMKASRLGYGPDSRWQCAKPGQVKRIGTTGRDKAMDLLWLGWT